MKKMLLSFKSTCIILYIYYLPYLYLSISLYIIYNISILYMQYIIHLFTCLLSIFPSFMWQGFLSIIFKIISLVPRMVPGTHRAFNEYLLKELITRLAKNKRGSGL